MPRGRRLTGGCSCPPRAQTHRALVASWPHSRASQLAVKAAAADRLLRQAAPAAPDFEEVSGSRGQ